MIRLVRRPPFPGELNHELVWPAAFLASVGLGWGWFQTGWSLPPCLFHELTGWPCLGCGGTRCARHLAHGDFAGAFLYHPGFMVFFCLGLLWTAYAACFWLGRGSLRLRLAIDEEGSRRLRLWGLALIALHWAWQFHYLTR